MRKKLRKSRNRFVAVADTGEIVGLVAAKNRPEAEEDFASLGLTGTIYTKQEFKQTEHYERLRLQEKRGRILSRINKITRDFDDSAALQHVAEATLTPLGRRLRKRYLKKLERLQWVLDANEAELDAYNPDTDPDLRNNE